MKKTIVILLISLLLPVFSYSQVELPQVIPPSAEASAFARYGEIPVDYSTGVPRVEIPLYSLKSGKLQLPISLSYHASGIKVNDYATSVGLGWVLNANGVIARTVFGIADERANYKPFKTSEDISNFISEALGEPEAGKLGAAQTLKELHEGVYDTQSDRYNYNFPGHAGIFRNDFITGEQMTIPYAPIKINRKKHDPDDGIPYFEIIAEDGTLYIFDDVESSLAVPNNFGMSWYLSKIISYDYVDTISFTYEQGEAYWQDQFSQYLEDGEVQTDLTHSQRNYDFKTSNNYVIHSPIYLKKIDSRTTKIELEYLDDRPDKITTRLINVTVYDKGSGNLIRKIDLEQDYFGAEEDKNLRLRLAGVTISGQDTSEEERYSFTYNSKELPPYYGDAWDLPERVFYEDYWGYYNGANSSSMIPKEFISNQSADIAHIYGGNRNPNKYFMDACMLQEIRYPTGGKTVFEFEPNKAGPNYYGYTNSNDGVVGGLRVKSIKSYPDEVSLPVVKTYEYPGFISDQRVVREFYSYIPHYTYKVWHSRHNFLYSCFNHSHYVSFSSPSGPLTQTNGSPVIYSKVIEYSGVESNNIGKKEYYYSYEGVQFNYEMPGPRYTDVFHYDRGLSSPRLTREIVYKNVGGTYEKVNSTVYSYSFLKNHEFNTGLKVDRLMNYVIVGDESQQAKVPFCSVDNYLQEFIYSETKGYTDVPLLTAKHTYEYESETDFVEKSVFYSYENLDHLQPTQETTVTSKDETYKTAYKYPLELAAPGNIYEAMVSKNILTPVIEQSRYLDDTFLDSVRTNYKDWGNNIIAPCSIEVKNGANPFETRLTYSAYDDKGNPLTVSKDDGPVISYLWGYDQTMPIAKVENAPLSSKGATRVEQKLSSFNNFTSEVEGAIALPNGTFSIDRLQTVKISVTLASISASSNGSRPNDSWFYLGLPEANNWYWSYTVGADGSGPVSQTHEITLSPGTYSFKYRTLLKENSGLQATITVDYTKDVPYSNIFHTSFEEDGNANTTHFHTGRKSHGGAYTLGLPGEPGNYTLSYWIKQGANPWEYREEEITIASSSPATKTIGGAGAWLDEVRFYPSDARMTTYTYDPLTGMTSATDENNIPTYYEYDAFGRLQAVKDNKGNILKTYTYHYKQ